MATISRKQYASLYGPTKGDKIRLGDTSLFAEIERDHTVYGEECWTGAGRVMRDGMAYDAHTSRADGAIDMLVENATIIDPVLGIIKADIGIRDGKIAGVGKAGNPNIQDGVDDNMVCGPNTTYYPAGGLIVTPGGIDVHIHFLSTEQCENAISTGLTTMIGGSMGPLFAIDCGGPWNTHRMIEASEKWPINFGFFGRGSSHDPDTVAEHLDGGIIGVKIHEDYGAMPATIDGALTASQEYDFPVMIHTDTLNESGFYEDTLAAIAGRAMHMYHTEGGGGGHAPDIIRCNGEPHLLPSTTNPTNPYSLNAFDEGLDMTMSCHLLRYDLPEDVAFAESRVRPQTMMAEDVLHDLGAISMFGSDSQGMGRVNEVISRCWQLASKMRDQRGRLGHEKTRDADNERIKRYIAKYTINAARAFGIDKYIGSIEPGKMADLVTWKPAFFGIKPLGIIKGGFVAHGATGDSAGSYWQTEPVLQRAQFGGCGKAPQSLSATFVHQRALDLDVAGQLGLAKALLPITSFTSLSKKDMLHNDACPDIRVDPSTFDVTVDGELAACEPIADVSLGQNYMLR
ncbi:MAG: urease subunit alpha [Alphaproteobacteria bacterium]|nr:urease subunit alpha [Alphaproteobacteria bacterium]